jgi:hypothetical protein
MMLAQGLMPPGTWGYDPSFKSSMNEHSPAKAKALLDLHGFKDRDGDGWRERPDGSPLRLRDGRADQCRGALARRHLGQEPVGVGVRRSTSSSASSPRTSRPAAPASS